MYMPFIKCTSHPYHSYEANSRCQEIHDPQVWHTSLFHRLLRGWLQQGYAPSDLSLYPDVQPFEQPNVDQVTLHKATSDEYFTIGRLSTHTVDTRLPKAVNLPYNVPSTLQRSEHRRR